MSTKQKISALKYNLIPKGRILYFNEEAHKYTDDINTNYTSTTTIIGKYYEKFDSKAKEIAAACERIGKNPNHPKHERYKGKTAKQLLYEWEEEKNRACTKGTNKHNYLENTIKSSTGYKLTENGFINDRIYTIDNIIKGHNYGILSLEYFKRTGIDQMYPQIYGLLVDLSKAGFKIYAEIGVYDVGFRISGLIDILLVRGMEFMILDWKTNKAPIRFESGYYDKDNNNNLILESFIYQDKYFYAPLTHLADSVGNHYTLQLSTYDYLVESFGFRCLGNILCHIRTIESSTLHFEEGEKEEVKFLSIQYLKQEVEDMLTDNIKKQGVKQTLF